MELIYNCASAQSGIDWPAWVQAIGSVIAILVAVYVPWRQRQHALEDEAEKNRNRAKVIATALEPALSDTQAALKTMQHYASLGFADRSVLDRSLLVRHPEYDQFRSDLYLLGDLGTEINKAISWQTYFLDALDVIKSNRELPVDFSERFEPEVSTAISRLDTCLTRLRNVMD